MKPEEMATTSIHRIVHGNFGLSHFCCKLGFGKSWLPTVSMKWQGFDWLLLLPPFMTDFCDWRLDEGKSFGGFLRRQIAKFLAWLR
jgi:hypothetical protein